MNQFQQGDSVIGHDFPDLIPAKVTKVLKPSIGGEYELPLVEIEFIDNGVKKKTWN